MFGKLYLLPKVSNTPPNPPLQRGGNSLLKPLERGGNSFLKPLEGGGNSFLKPPFIRGVGGVMSEKAL